MKPPGAILLVAGYGAGLVTGLARFPDPWLVPLALLAVWCLLRDEWFAVALLAAVAGCGIGWLSQARAGSDCAATLPLGDNRYTVRLVEPGTGSGKVVPVDRACRGTVTAAWPAGTRLAAGAVAIVQARWEPRFGPLHRPGGVLAVRRVLVVGRGHGVAAGLREAAWTAARRLYGRDAGVAAGLVIGWRGALQPEVRRQFAAAGLMPLLAISGFHIALIAGWILLLLRAARVPRTAARCTAVCVALAYVSWLGWPAPALRAVTLLAVAAWSDWRQRKPRVDATVAVSVLIVLCEDPWAVVDPGAWLSVLGLSGVLATLRWCDRAGVRRAWARTVLVSVGATLATAPVAALVFGRVAPIGVLLFPVAMPLLALAMPCLLVSVLLVPWLPSVAGAFAVSAGLLLRALVGLARLGAMAPGAGSGSSGGIAAALPWIAVACVAAWVVRRAGTTAEATRRLLWTATAACWITLVPGIVAASPLGRHELALVFLDVGQGDGALLRTPAGHWVEIDAGPVTPEWNAGERVVAPALRRYGVRRIDLFVLSHAHRDHVGGATAITEQWPVGLAVEPGERFADTAYEEWLGALAAAGALASGGGGRQLGDRQRPVPGAASTEGRVHWGDDLNEDSIVLDVRYGRFRALLMGDAGFVAEATLEAWWEASTSSRWGITVRTAPSGAFLAETPPEAAVMSVGAPTSTVIPRAETLIDWGAPRARCGARTAREPCRS